MREYDAHIYFTKESTHSAGVLRQRMLDEFPVESFRIGRLIHQPIGPHPQPMFEVNFKKNELDKVISWLDRNRGRHGVLIHPVTGNDLADHTVSARWLGPVLQLDLSQL